MVMVWPGACRKGATGAVLAMSDTNGGWGARLLLAGAESRRWDRGWVLRERTGQGVGGLDSRRLALEQGGGGDPRTCESASLDAAVGVHRGARLLVADRNVSRRRLAMTMGLCEVGVGGDWRQGTERASLTAEGRSGALQEEQLQQDHREGKARRSIVKEVSEEPHGCEI